MESFKCSHSVKFLLNWVRNLCFINQSNLCISHVTILSFYNFAFTGTLSPSKMVGGPTYIVRTTCPTTKRLDQTFIVTIKL